MRDWGGDSSWDKVGLFFWVGGGPSRRLGGLFPRCDDCGFAAASVITRLAGMGSLPGARVRPAFYGEGDRTSTCGYYFYVDERIVPAFWDVFMVELAFLCRVVGGEFRVHASVQVNVFVSAWYHADVFSRRVGRAYLKG